MNNDFIKQAIKNEEKLSKAYKIIGFENKSTWRGDRYIQINYIPKTSPQTQSLEWIKVFYENEN